MTPTRKQWIGLAKVAITAGLIWAVYRYFLKIERWEEVGKQLRGIPVGVYILALLGAGLSWWIEAMKWRVLMQQVSPMSRNVALKSTLGGAAVSNVFPFRVGEYLGRVVWVADEFKLEAAVLSVAGSMTQMFITLLLGIPPAALLLEYGTGIRGSVVAAMVLMVGVFILLRRWAIKGKGQGKEWVKKIREGIATLEGNQMGRVFSYSLIRYGVFSFTYAGMLVFSGAMSSFSGAWCGVATIYLLQSFAPGMILTDAGVRTALPIFVLGAVVKNHELLLALALVNYFASVLLPGMAGTILILLRKRNAI